MILPAGIYCANRIRRGRPAGLALIVAGVASLACQSAKPARTDSTSAATDTTVTASSAPVDTAADNSVDTLSAGTAGSTPRHDARSAQVVLSPLADSIAQRLVFMPTLQTWFLAQARGKNMLIDLGRVDFEVGKKPDRLAAFRSAAAALSPVRKGDTLQLRGPWGRDTAIISGFDVWNGRIVATVTSSPRVDSLARTVEPLVAVAVRPDTIVPATDSLCDRTLPEALKPRLKAITDSLEQVLKSGDQPAYPRLQKTLKSKTTVAPGCFLGGRAIVAATLWGGDYEWVRERVVLVSETGAVKALTVRDYRFRAHELLQALDADEDGLDDVAVRGYTTRSGATTVLRLTEAGRLERVAAGFAWER